MIFRREAHGDVTRFQMARTLLGQPIKVASCYRVGPFLVDTGPPFAARRLKDALGGPPRAILVTHGHEDHFGSAAALGAPALGHARLALARGIPRYRRWAWGEPLPARVEPVGDGVDAQGLELRPVATPGHTPDHLSYWEPGRGWLFAGDAVLGLLKYGFRDEDLRAYMASLRVLRDLQPAVVFPAHGPVLTEPAEQLGAQLAHLERLRDAARALREEGLGDAAIARRLLGRDGALGRISGGEFSKELLIRGLLREGP